MAGAGLMGSKEALVPALVRPPVVDPVEACSKDVGPATLGQVVVAISDTAGVALIGAPNVALWAMEMPVMTLSGAGILAKGSPFWDLAVVCEGEVSVFCNGPPDMGLPVAGQPVGASVETVGVALVGKTVVEGSELRNPVVGPSVVSCGALVSAMVGISAVGATDVGLNVAELTSVGLPVGGW